MLSAARSDRNVTLAKSVFDRIQNYFPENKDCLTSAAVLLANTYALSGDMSTASSIRMKLCQTGMKRKGGISSTVHSGNIVVSETHPSKKWLTLFSLAISSSRPISPSIKRNICRVRSSELWVNETWLCAWFKLVDSSTDERWDRRIVTLWPQREISNRFSVDSKTNSNSYSSDEEFTCLWRLP